MTTIRHVSVSIGRPADEVYAYAADPANLSAWAAGLAGQPLEKKDGRWVAQSPMGEVAVEFTPPNDYGVLDHVVTLPSGERVLNPVRVLADGDRSDVVFTIRRRDMTEAQFDADSDAVARDLTTLKEILEAGPRPG